MSKSLISIMVLFAFLCGCSEAFDENQQDLQRQQSQENGEYKDGQSRRLPSQKDKEKQEKEVRELIQNLRVKDKKTYFTAFGRLVEIGEPAVEPLTNALNHEDWPVRAAAAEILAEIGAESVVQHLRKLLKEDNVTMVRQSAAYALLKLSDDDEAIDVLAQGLRKTESSRSRAYVAHMLGRTKNPRVVYPLIEALRDSDPNVQNSAAEALAAMGQIAITPLVEALADRDRVVRCYVVGILGNVGGDKAVGALIGALKPENIPICGTISDALAAIGAPAVERLIKSLKNDSDIVRSFASLTLGKIGDKRAVDSLMYLLDDVSTPVRGIAIEALGRIGDKKALKPIMELFERDEDIRIHTSAACALVKIDGDERGMHHLKMALNDPNPAVRILSIRSMRAVGCENWAIKLLAEKLGDDVEDVARSASVALAEIGEPAVASLIETLKTGNASARAKAVTALGAIGDASAFEPLVEALAKGDDQVSSAAALALGRLQMERAIAHLIRALKHNNSETRRCAAAALRSITGLDHGTSYYRWKKWDNSNKQ